MFIAGLHKIDSRQKRSGMTIVKTQKLHFKRLQMKNALITGASGGIGTALCSAYKQAGYVVIATDMEKNPALQCDVFIECNLLLFVRDESYRKTKITEFKKQFTDGLTTLINNAATQILGSTEKITVQNWHDTLDVNLIAPFMLTQTFLKELEQVKASVVNISSVHQTATKPEFVAYATSKSALSGLTRSMAIDLGNKIRVNGIAPAATATPMLLAGFEGKKEKLAELSAMHPIGRIAEPEEIASVALFLSSEHANFITGAVISVDGGISGRLHDPV